MRRKPGRPRIISKYLAIAVQAGKNRLAYPKDILGGAMFLVLILFIYNALWTRVLGREGSFSGFTHGQLLWYLAWTESLIFSFPKLQDRVNDEIKTGNIAYRLNKPLRYLGQLLAEYLGETLAAAAPLLCAACLMAALLAGRPPAIAPWQLAAAAAAFALGVLVSFCLTASLAMSAFWVEENGPYFWLYSKINFVLGGLFLPVEIYPGFLRRLAELLPFRLSFAAGARLAVSFDWQTLGRTLAWQICWLMPLLLLTLCIYARGVRKLNVNGG